MSTGTGRLLLAAAAVGIGLAMVLRPAPARPASARSLTRRPAEFNWDRTVGDDFEDLVYELMPLWNNVQAGQIIEQLHALRIEMTASRTAHVQAAGQALDEQGRHNLACFRDQSIRLRALVEELQAIGPEIGLEEMSLRYSNARWLSQEFCDLQERAADLVSRLDPRLVTVFESVLDLREIEDGVSNARRLIEQSSVSTPFSGGIELAAVAGYLNACVQAA